MKVNNYIYLDEQAIEGQYSQLLENITSLKCADENEIESAIEGSGEGSLLKILSAKLVARITGKRKVTREVTVVTSIEQKTTSLIDRYTDEKNGLYLVTNINDLSVGNARIIYGYATFYTAQIYVDGIPIMLDTLNDVNANATLALVAGNFKLICERYHYPQISQRNESVLGMHMFLGSENMRLRIRHIGREMRRGGHVKLWVLGELTRIDEFEFSLKPFAVHKHYESW